MLGRRPELLHAAQQGVGLLQAVLVDARAVQLAAEEGGFDAVRAFSVAITEMAEGEVLQLQRAGDLSCDYDTYLDVISRKSAALIAWCAAAPAWANGDSELAEALTRYGRGVGRAFQITDDVLDYSVSTGKTRGADLRERKVTLPLLIAMDRLDGLRDELMAAAPNPAELPALMSRIEACGALDEALSQAQSFVTSGIAALDVLPATEGRDALAALGRFLVERAS